MMHNAIDAKAISVTKVAADSLCTDEDPVKCMYSIGCIGCIGCIVQSIGGPSG